MNEIIKKKGKVSITVEDDVWNDNIKYEKLTIVKDSEDNVYMSKKDVPLGTDLSDDTYWLLLVSSTGGGNETSISTTYALPNKGSINIKLSNNTFYVVTTKNNVTNPAELSSLHISDFANITNIAYILFCHNNTTIEATGAYYKTDFSPNNNPCVCLITVLPNGIYLINELIDS